MPEGFFICTTSPHIKNPLNTSKDKSNIPVIKMTKPTFKAEHLETAVMQTTENLRLIGSLQ